MTLRLRCSLALLLMCVPLAAQPQPSRHKLGLALSGGGALGLAHIGVIQYFEEHHIPIDYVAGTSMGGLVGGFYATGMDSAQMKTFVAHADWDAWLNPNPRFVDQPVVEKQAWNRASGDLALRFGHRFSLPAGLNSGALLALVLSHQTMAYAGLGSFDDLPTPFRCVATDLIKGDRVVLSNGSLAKAMRATMSIPAIFTPVRWDNMVLVDGGLVENVPVQTAREMGASAVIAVTLRAPQPDPEQFKTLTGVLRQTVSVTITLNERRSVALADLDIDVDTTKFSGTDYSKADDLIALGYKTAAQMGDRLKAFELPDDEWQAYLRQRAARTCHVPDSGRVVAVVAATPDFQQNAQHELQRKLGDGVVPERKLDDVLTCMVAATGVAGASYGWQPADGQPEGYSIRFQPRPGEQVLARPSLYFASSSGEPTRAGLKLSTSTIFANTYNARFLSAATIGYDPGIQMEYYHPFDGSAFFVAPGIFVQREHVGSYSGPLRTDRTRDRFGGSFYAGIGTWPHAQARVGVRAGYDFYDTAPLIDGVRSRTGAWVNPETVWIYNSQDSGGLPTHGIRAEVTAGYSIRDTSFPYFREEFLTVRPAGRLVTLFVGNEAATSFGHKLGYYDQFTFGGAHQLSAFRYQELHANTLVAARGGVVLHAPIVRSLGFSFQPALVTWYEAGRFDLGSQGWQTHQSASTGIFVPTPLGAAGLAVSFNEYGKARLRLMLGGF